MLYKSKANRIGNESLAALGLRLIDTVMKSGIDEAKSSKQFVQLNDVNLRYQVAIEPGKEKQISDAIKVKFSERTFIFNDMYEYVKGLLKSPDPEMKEVAILLFEQLNKYGKNFSKFKIADQSLRYIRIIESLKKDEYKAAITKTLLTVKMGTLDQIQLDYEDLYLGRGNDSSTKVAPSNIRKEMEDAIKLYVDEVRWMATRMDTELWHTLLRNITQRFDEVNVSMTRKKAGSSDTSTSTIV